MAYLGKSKYFEIKEKLEYRITNGEYSLGSLLPSEFKLSEEFHVSRGTIRQALSTLEREGIIARKSGVGTFIVRKPKQSSIISFTQQILSKNKKPLTMVLKKEIINIKTVQGSFVESFVIGETKQSDIYSIERLRYADDEPVAFQIIYLNPTDFNPGFLIEEDFSKSLFEIYNKYNRHPSWANENIKARKPTEVEKKLLGLNTITDNIFVYSRERITYDDNNQPLEILLSVERNDLFSYYQYRILSENN